MKRFLLYLRAPFFTAVLVPAALGAAVAYRFEHKFDIILFVITCVGLMAANGGVNLLNDYIDYIKGRDTATSLRTPFAGGSPFLPEGIEKPRTFLVLSALMFVLALACGIYLAVRIDGGFGPILALAIIGGVLGILYNISFAYWGIGEIVVFLLCGPLPVLGSYYVQTGELSARAVAASVPVAFFITAILWVNEIPDAPQDGRAGKRTMVVRLGTQRSAWILGFLFTAGYAWVVLMAVAGFGAGVLLALLSAPVAYNAALRALDCHDQPAELLPAQRDTIISHLALGVLLTVGVLI